MQNSSPGNGPAVEIDRVHVTAIAVNTFLELVLVYENLDLREDGFTLIHDLRIAASSHSTNLWGSIQNIINHLFES